MSKDKLEEALRLILPLAKGYASAHPVGSNAEYIAYAQEILESVIVAPESAVEIPMDDCGLSINAGRDGTWLHFRAKSGKSAGINVENWANSKDGGIVAQALREWAADRQEQATAIKGHSS